MRALSLRQAQNCETAQHPKCRCRCHGVAHGGRRAGAQEAPERVFFESLPDDDPHRLPTMDELAERRRQKRERSYGMG